MQKKAMGAILPYLAVGALVVIAVVGLAMFFGFSMDSESLSFSSNGDDSTKSMGVPVESLTVLAVNKHTGATEGSDDVEFWRKGTDITDTSKSPAETLDLSSGSVTDTSVPNLRSGSSPADLDLYFEGTGNYYDVPLASWEIEYNIETGKGSLVVPGTLADGANANGAVVMTDVGTFKDFDAGVSAYDTGFQENSDGTINYSISGGDGTVYLDLIIGNDEQDSELDNAVLCIGDADGDLEGNEISSLTVSKQSGDSIGSIASDLYPLFSQSAGTGSYSCTSIGDIVGLKTGTYRFSFTITEGNFEANEDFEIGVDDLGGWKQRQYPSSNLKASAEDLQIIRVA